MADEKKGKPSLALIIAAAKKPTGAKPLMADKAAGGEGDYASQSPECVKCVQHFFEAGADGDYEDAASALASAVRHIDSGDAGEEAEEV